MKIYITGSRDYPSPELAGEFVRGLTGQHVILHGSPKIAVEGHATRAARAIGLGERDIGQRWRGRPDAGARRVYAAVRAADCIVTFWDGASRGTCMLMARALGAGNLWVVYGPTARRLYTHESGSREGLTHLMRRAYGEALERWLT